MDASGIARVPICRCRPPTSADARRSGYPPSASQLARTRPGSCREPPVWGQNCRVARARQKEKSRSQTSDAVEPRHCQPQLTPATQRYGSSPDPADRQRPPVSRRVLSAGDAARNQATMASPCSPEGRNDRTTGVRQQLHKQPVRAMHQCISM